MALESATYIPDLVPANPVQTDPLAQSYDHLNLIKQVLQNQFPDIGDAAVTATAAQLNSAAGAFGSAGVLEVAAGSASAQLKLDPVATSGAVLVENSGTAGNPGAFAWVANDATNANPLTAATLTRAGAFSAVASVNAPAILQAGSALLPPGCITLWYGSVASIPAGYALCDGGTYNGYITPNLIGRLVIQADASVNLPGSTGGSTTGSGTTSTVGSHNHTGASGSAGAVTPTGVTDTQGSHAHTGATAGHVLTVAELPPHTHEQNIGVTGSGGVAGPGSLLFGVASDAQCATLSTGSGNNHTHAIATDGAHAHNLSISPIAAHQHSISSDGSHNHTVTVSVVPPYYALCYIMRVA